MLFIAIPPKMKTVCCTSENGNSRSVNPSLEELKIESAEYVNVYILLLPSRAASNENTILSTIYIFISALNAINFLSSICLSSYTYFFKRCLVSFSRSLSTGLNNLMLQNLSFCSSTNMIYLTELIHIVRFLS